MAALAVGAGVLMAQSEEDGDGASFLDRVAAKLGIQSEELAQAIEDVRVDEINERVAAGDLTQEEADELIQRLDGLPPDALLGRGHPDKRFDFEFRGGDGGFGFHFGFGHHGFGFGANSDELAELLGISGEQLREELQADGATLATVAEAHGVSREELTAFILEGARERLATAVAEENITQERADEVLANLEERVDELIDHEFPGKLRPRFGPFDEDGSGEDDGAIPDGTPEEQSGANGEFPSS